MEVISCIAWLIVVASGEANAERSERHEVDGNANWEITEAIGQTLFRREGRVVLDAETGLVVLSADFGELISAGRRVQTALKTKRDREMRRLPATLRMRSGEPHQNHTVRSYNEMLAEVEQELELVTSTWSATVAAEGSVGRDKRGFWQMLGTALGIYNRMEVSDIQRSLEHLRTAERKTVGELKAVRISEEATIEAMNKLMGATSVLRSEVGELEILANFEAWSSKFKEESRRMRVILREVPRHRVPMAAAVELGLDEAWDNFTTMAKRQGRIPAINETTQLLQLHADFFATSDTLTVTVVVPMKKEGTEWAELYRALPIPIMIGDRMVEITTTRRWMVDVSPALYTVMTDEEVEACDRVGRDFLCSEAHVILQSEEECLRALWKGRPEPILANCWIKRLPARPEARPVNSTHFWIAAPEELIANVKCGEGRVETIRLQGTFLIWLREGCALHSQSFHLYPRKATRIRQTMPTRVVGLGEEPEGSGEEIGWQNLNAEIQNDEENILEEVGQAEPAKGWKIAFWCLAAAAVTLGCVVTVFSVYRRLRRNGEESEVALEMSAEAEGKLLPAHQGTQTPRRMFKNPGDILSEI